MHLRKEEPMDIEIVKTIVAGLFGLVSGAVLAYLGAVLKFRKDLEAEYDKDLREKRIETYQTLWSHLQLLARYDRPKPLNRKTLKELTVAMHKWYFETGGLYLSEDTRKDYFDLKKIIKDILESGKYRGDEALDPPDLPLILEKASLLRAQLTRDIGTRKSSAIADS
jgi:hypothetical protein